ncbi:MAG: polysaccharide biosynthesis PFTS motif protein [Candidatus Omnitrophota bacterium]
MKNIKKNRMSKKVIIFEELKPCHKWIVKWYLWGKNNIYFMRLNRLCADKSWVKRYVNIRCLKKIDSNFKIDMLEGEYNDAAFDNIEEFSCFLEGRRIVKRNKEIYNSDDILLAYKKALHKRLSRFYGLNYILNEFGKRFFKNKVSFIPSNGIDIYRTDGCEICYYFSFYRFAEKIKTIPFDVKNAGFPIWAVIFSYVRYFKEKIHIIVKIFAFFFWNIYKMVVSIGKQNKFKSRYKYAVMIISTLRQFSNDVQKVDFLIDDKSIKKEDVIFISYRKLKTEHKDYLENNNLAYLDRTNYFVSWEEIKKNIPLYVEFLISSIKEPNFIMDVSFRLSYFYLCWEGFLKNIRLENLITYADFGIQSIARNIILKKHNCRTYFYIDSANVECFFEEQKRNVIRYRCNFFSFLLYDYFISWNDELSRFFKSLCCEIRHYIDYGCLWAEHVRNFQISEKESTFKKQLFNYGYQENFKLICVFDSTIHDATITTYRDGIKFLEGIYRLLEENLDIFVVLKEKKGRHIHCKWTPHYHEILHLFEKLENHVRCFCLKGGEQKWMNSSVMVAAADVTISFPYTSPTFEALAARKKALWYDASGKLRNTFYGAIPGVVCHNYQELVNRVNELLFKTTEQEYNNYLEKYVKGKIESYLDGKALTRFREHLVCRDQDKEPFKEKQEAFLV